MTALPLRDFTAAEQAKLAAIEAAPAAAESVRERVALAIWNVDMRDEMTPLDWRAALNDDDREFYREQADAAIAVLRGPGSDAEQAVERVLQACVELDNTVGEADDESEWSGGYASGHWAAADRIRAAVAGD